jgi:hypothetical protein
VLGTTGMTVILQLTSFLLVRIGVHWRADRLEWCQGALGDAASRRALNWGCNAPRFFSEPYPLPPVFCTKESRG